MNTKLSLLSSIALCAFAARAQAQTVTHVEKPEGAGLEVPVKGLEILGSTGYTQGFGEIQSGVSTEDVITRGLGVEVSIGYRFDPHWVLSAVGQYQQFDAQRAATARGLTAGGAFTYHILPYNLWDPWLQLGGGYRLLWETGSSADPTPVVLTHGFEPVKLLVGLDYRATRDIAFCPMVGVDLTVPLWQSVGGASSVAIADPRPSTYIYAALGARFDVTSQFARRPAVQPVAQNR